MKKLFTQIVLILGIIGSLTAQDQKAPIGDHLYEIIKKEGISEAINVYHHLKIKKNNQYDFSENQLNQLGYKLLGEGKVDAAEAILKLNKEQFPGSVNTYDSYADVLLRNNKKDQAQEQFKKVLEMLSESNLSPNAKAFFKSRAELQINMIENLNLTEDPAFHYHAYYGWGPAGTWDVNNLIAFKDVNNIEDIGYKQFNFYTSPVPQFVHNIFNSETEIPDAATSFMGGVYWGYIEAGKLKDLSGLWEKHNLKSKFPESIRKLASHNGKPYFIPHVFQLNPIWYRKDIFEKYDLKVPENWDELLTLCDKLYENNISPFTVSAAGWPPPVARWFSILNLRINGAEFHKKLLMGKIKYTDERVRKVFEHWKVLFEHHAFADSSFNNNWGAAVSDLSGGKAAMYNIGEWIFESPPVANIIDKLDFFTFPEIYDQIPQAEICHVYGGFIPTSSGNEETAENFLTYLISMRSLKSNLIELKYRTPANKELYDEINDLKKKQYDIVQSVETLVPLFEFSTHPKVADTALKVFAEFWKDQSDIEGFLKRLEEARLEAYNN